MRAFEKRRLAPGRRTRPDPAGLGTEQALVHEVADHTAASGSLHLEYFPVGMRAVADTRIAIAERRSAMNRIGGGLIHFCLLRGVTRDQGDDERDPERRPNEEHTRHPNIAYQVTPLASLVSKANPELPIFCQVAHLDFLKIAEKVLRNRLRRHCAPKSRVPAAERVFGKISLSIHWLSVQ